VKHNWRVGRYTRMRTAFLTFTTLVVMLTSPHAMAKSEMQCRLEARRITGDIQGLEFTQALTGCMLDTSPRPTPREITVIEEEAQPTVAFSTSRSTPSGTWVRLSPYRWVLRPH
jgi:hypothetical protein